MREFCYLLAAFVVCGLLAAWLAHFLAMRRAYRRLIGSHIRATHSVAEGGQRRGREVADLASWRERRAASRPFDDSRLPPRSRL